MLILPPPLTPIITVLQPQAPSAALRLRAGGVQRGERVRQADLREGVRGGPGALSLPCRPHPRRQQLQAWLRTGAGGQSPLWHGDALHQGNLLSFSALRRSHPHQLCLLSSICPPPPPLLDSSLQPSPVLPVHQRKRRRDAGAAPLSLSPGADLPEGPETGGGDAPDAQRGRLPHAMSITVDSRHFTTTSSSSTKTPLPVNHLALYL